jgi:membrane-associated protease RseP (regulator of RpoE activity)
MSVITKGRIFANGEQLTAEKLNVLVDEASFNSSTAVDNSTTRVSASGAITVKPQGITSTELAPDAVITAKIANSNVTKAKIENVANMKVLGNTSGSATAPQEVSVLDEDNMSSNSATSLATQQSIKAYFDEYALKEPTSGKTGTFGATTSWTDLNLSTAVGANKAMVVMEVYDSSNSINLNFRTKGSAIDRFTTVSTNGAGAAGLIVSTNNIGGVVTIVTDASGIIQYKGDGTATGINYNILAYQKLI